MWPFKKMSAVAWEDQFKVPTPQERIDSLTGLIENNKAKLLILKEHARLYHFEWHKEMTDLQYSNYLMDKERREIMNSDGFAHD